MNGARHVGLLAALLGLVPLASVPMAFVVDGRAATVLLLVADWIAVAGVWLLTRAAQQPAEVGDPEQLRRVLFAPSDSLERWRAQQ